MEQQKRDYASRNYAALRGIASLCTGLGWLIVGLAGMSAFGSLFTVSSRNGFVLGFGGFVASVIVGGFCFIVLRVIAESISVLLDIEFNTRQTAINTQQIPSSSTLAKSLAYESTPTKSAIAVEYKSGNFQGALAGFMAKIDHMILDKSAEEYCKRGNELASKNEFDDAILEFVKVIRISAPEGEWYQSAQTGLKTMGFSETDIEQVRS